MDGLSEFLNMGGYAFYVWTSYGIAALVLLANLVVPGSVRREQGSIEVAFDLTDNKDTVTVVYSGILPDLFREGQGIVSLGKLREDGVFVANEVLAKHDENYMPPEVAESLAKHTEAKKAAIAAEQTE